MSINCVMISGNITRDASLSETHRKNPVLNFTVAVNDRWLNNETNEWESRPNYVDCAVFGKRAEGLNGYLKKGTKVSVKGRLKQSQWETKEGEKRNRISVTVDELEFMSPRRQHEQDDSSADEHEHHGKKHASNHKREEAPQEYDDYEDDGEEQDEDVPF